MDKQLESQDFIPLNLFEKLYPVKTDLVYAQTHHPDNHFPELYDPSAKLLWVHKDLLPVILLASVLCEQRHGWTLIAHDCLRPTEAQAKMAIYGYPPELVSSPGMGAHPRGMSIDFLPAGVDMGTPYDHFAEDLSNNPAARNATSFPGKTPREAIEIVERRRNFESAVREAASAFGHEIYPLAEEWWDFRFEKEGTKLGSTYWASYAPVDEQNLPGYMRLVSKPDPVPAHIEKGWEETVHHVDDLVRTKAQEIGAARADLALPQAQDKVQPL
jgi:D-alanyl-D-alanine dipeptidase